MSIRPLVPVLAATFLVVQAASATALTVLTTGKHAVFTANKARVLIGRDPRLTPLADPQCGGVETRIQIAAYPQATNRLEAQQEVLLPCANWKRAGKGYLYKDDTGAAGGVTKVLYSTKRLQVHFKGDHYVPFAGPVGYAELWFTVNTTRFLARFHNFTKNTATTLATVKASKLAGEGEAAFWEVLLGDDKSDANQLRALDLLGRATNTTRKDGRSPFLCGMMHLYRYGLFVDDAGEPTAASRREIDAAVDAFEIALPRVWDADTRTGDSRVPGFAAAAVFAQGYAHGHEAAIGGLESPWPFQALADARVLDVEARIARYQDDDPSNDDPVVGIQEENCAVCHNR